MKIDYNVPFYSNTSDDSHCFQASLKMILKYFIPQKEYDWEELDKVTAKIENLWTWQFAGIIWMQENGFEIINIEEFDYNKFINEGEKFILEEFGQEMGEAQIMNSDIAQEQILAKKFIEKISTNQRIPNIDDIKYLLNEGYIVMCAVNSYALNQEVGYCGHSIVVKGYDHGNFIIHDPGLPSLENRLISFEIFEKAWAYPNDKVKNIIAFKYKH